MNIEVAIVELRRRAQTVPIPPRLPSGAKVAAAERELGTAFPADYRRYLLEASDVVFDNLEPALVVADAGYRDLIAMARVAWSLGVPHELLPFYAVGRSARHASCHASRTRARISAGAEGSQKLRIGVPDEAHHP